MTKQMEVDKLQMLMAIYFKLNKELLKMEEIQDLLAMVEFKIDAVLNFQMEINSLEYLKMEDQTD
jgi:hypothetical protein